MSPRRVSGLERTEEDVVAFERENSASLLIDGDGKEMTFQAEGKQDKGTNIQRTVNSPGKLGRCKKGVERPVKVEHTRKVH